MLISVDTNVLLDLALETGGVMDALETIRERVPKARFVVSPTVLHELALAVRKGETHKMRKAALKGLSSLREWGIEPLNLIPVGHGIVERISEALLRAELLPLVEKNDSLIIAESALLGCSILLSADSHMRGIDFQKFTLTLQDFHVGAPLIATPREIVRKFYR